HARMVGELILDDRPCLRVPLFLNEAFEIEGQKMWMIPIEPPGITVEQRCCPSLSQCLAAPCPEKGHLVRRKDIRVSHEDLYHLQGSRGIAVHPHCLILTDEIAAASVGIIACRSIPNVFEKRRIQMADTRGKTALPDLLAESGRLIVMTTLVVMG